jgi:SM-20-related protein
VDVTLALAFAQKLKAGRKDFHLSAIGEQRAHFAAKIAKLREAKLLHASGAREMPCFIREWLGERFFAHRQGILKKIIQGEEKHGESRLYFSWKLKPKCNPLAIARLCQYTFSMNSTFIATQLGESGFCVCPDFLPPGDVEVLRNDVARLQLGQFFRRAGVGQGSEPRQVDAIRRDEICWLNREEANTTQEALWGKLEELQIALNRTLFLGLKSFEGHYALYPPGGFYRRHRDAFRGDSSRMVSIIIYLNAGWLPSHGGQLRVYEADSFRDIEPKGGTLVCFLSRDIEHEVLPALEPRTSFSGWFKI